MEFVKIREKIYPWLPWIIITSGVVFRVGQFLYNRSLTEGEAALALNIVGRSYAGLLKPLDYAQAAPVGFLSLQKFMVNTFGNSEYALRILPLITSIVSLLFFYQIAKKRMSQTGVLIGLILFACGEHLIAFSSEIKQYSSDVLWTLLLLWLGIRILIDPGQLNATGIIVLAIVGAVGVWFSFPSVFLFCGLGIILLVRVICNKLWHKLGWLIIGAGIWGVSLTINYSISLEALSKHQDLLNFWQADFMPLLPKSWADIKWFGYVFLRLFNNPLGLGAYAPLLALFSFCLGTVLLWQKSRILCAILLLPIILTLIGSGFRKYPFEGRVLLFIAPMMMLVIAHGLDYIREKTGQGSPLISIFLVLILLSYPVANALYRLGKPRAPEELRPVIEYLKKNYTQDDTIYLYYGAKNAFLYYSHKVGFVPKDCIIGIEARDNWLNYYQDLKRLKGKGRVWFLFSHITTWRGADEEKLFLSYLNSLGEQKDSFRAPGASAYLYNLNR